ncbi:hypothetical protein FHS61_000383 [Altererythrobacter atlanticus]|uniref:Uncharacterized protein n=1 Tax=Croceibacterium atlanticum TaxID=1267766 RepID=A0A0F7KQ01_9SPHN|nr:hypothetical protein [Croceibacterium atlanticum]AKH42613.1 hypothetical protein WYH_01576 [Croceibacterium atlanticum]MBB5731390.1 hypothetical protein [Croceibacterium atlanticum]
MIRAGLRITELSANGRRALVLVLGLLLAACGTARPGIEDQAERFVTIALSYAQIDEAVLDGYFGPEELRPAPDEEPTVEELRAQLVTLKGELGDTPPGDRAMRLLARIESLIALMDSKGDDADLNFAEEAEEVYGLTIAEPDMVPLDAARAELERLLPGPNSLAKRIAEFEGRFVIPLDRRMQLFERALLECRNATARHWTLPAGERLATGWTDAALAAWHRYEGGLRSRLQVNPMAVATIGSTLDIACHEAYPGHHAQFLAMEKAAGEGGLPVEDRLVLVQSPGQLLREGAAEYGLGLAFPEEVRAGLMRDILFPMAGFNPDAAAKYTRVHQLTKLLAAATTPILRDYLDGELTFSDAAHALENDALIASPRALLQFVRANRAYVLGYVVARDKLAGCIATRNPSGEAEGNWQALEDIVANSDLSALRGAACAG